ncbi:polyisoprenoid-binding protein YceI [Novosphingobium sp. SG751A]|uniref:YceI family protein n=1 Tax=Novosphingobium sp. SG751A TaxID=2587000 RepID=UPI001554C16A|nr:YceI family protein [Novosphingobium sp. SG751A]NOW48001.1 polyisoprenoid-binding protein YceI [Novosphingobium sp. SG751A]
MTFRCLAGAALAILAATPAWAEPGIVSRNPADLPAGAWKIDPGHASLTVRLSHLGFSFFTLRFDRIAAQFDYDPAHPAAAHVSAQIDPASVSTGQPALDKELAQEAWFDAAHDKTISFVSRSIDPGDGHRGTMTGDLTMRGVTRPVTLAVTFNGTGTGFGLPTPRAGFSASTVIHKSEFGMNRYASMLGDDVSVVIEAEFLRLPAKAGGAGQ